MLKTIIYFFALRMTDREGHAEGSCVSLLFTVAQQEDCGTRLRSARAAGTAAWDRCTCHFNGRVWRMRCEKIVHYVLEFDPHATVRVAAQLRPPGDLCGIR